MLWSNEIGYIIKKERIGYIHFLYKVRLLGFVEVQYIYEIFELQYWQMGSNRQILPKKKKKKGSYSVRTYVFHMLRTYVTILCN